MYYIMGFPSSNDHGTTNKDEKANIQSYSETKLKLSRFIQEKLETYLLTTPALIYNPNSKQVEMLLISKLQFTENEWEVLIASAIPEDVFHAQTGVMIEADRAASCIDRLILNQIKINQGNNPSHNMGEIEIEEVFLDAYRIGTQGLMHHLDHRPWKMKKKNILRLHTLQESVDKFVAEGIVKRKRIEHQIHMRNIIFEHANALLRRDPLKYGDIVPTVLEDHDLEVKRLMDQEIDIISDMDILFTKSEQIIKVLKRQVEIQTMLAEQKNHKRKSNK